MHAVRGQQHPQATQLTGLASRSRRGWPGEPAGARNGRQAAKLPASESSTGVSPTAASCSATPASRCPRKVGAICDTTPPLEHQLPGGHRIACHIPVEDLARLNAAE